jgi:DHA1 family bicyclomycin/chloramphenicol resistance-like MFS transporter
VIVTGVGPLALDTYIPALPAMPRSLHSTAAVIQLTVTAYIIGMALGQLIAGPLSDARGRRAYLLGCTADFTVLCAVCALAPTAGLLILARLALGLVAGGGIAVGRAVVSDHYRGEAAATRFGTLSSINLIGPVIAPVIGSVILTFGSWRSVFWALVGFGVLMVLAVLFRMPETLPVSERHPGGLAATLNRMSDLLGDKPFMRHVIIGCLSTAGFFVYIGGGSFVLQSVYGISQSTYAAVFAVNALAMVSASITFRLLVRRVGPHRLRAIGQCLAVTGGSLLLVLALLGVHRVPSVIPAWALLSCLTAGMGLINPACTTLAQQAGDRARGTAAALQGGGAFLIGALVTPLTGALGVTSLVPMAALMAGFMICAGLFTLVTARRGGWLRTA